MILYFKIYLKSIYINLFIKTKIFVGISIFKKKKNFMIKIQ